MVRAPNMPTTHCIAQCWVWLLAPLASDPLGVASSPTHSCPKHLRGKTVVRRTPRQSPSTKTEKQRASRACRMPCRAGARDVRAARWAPRTVSPSPGGLSPGGQSPPPSRRHHFALSPPAVGPGSSVVACSGPGCSSFDGASSFGAADGASSAGFADGALCSALATPWAG